MEPELIGIVRADISSMFFEEQSRPIGDDPSIVQYLTKVFDGGRCDRYDPEYFVLTIKLDNVSLHPLSKHFLFLY